MSTTVVLVRHGAHRHLNRILSGRTPSVSLAAEGVVQARAVANTLKSRSVAALYTSPLDRTRETATAIADALGLAVEIEDHLNEIDCGEWTGRSFDELGADERWHAWNRERAAGCPPGGEAMVAVQARVWSAVQRWCGGFPNGTVVAVTHSDVIKAAVCRCLDLSLDRYHAFDVEPASITTILAWDGGGKVVHLNERAAP